MESGWTTVVGSTVWVSSILFFQTLINITKVPGKEAKMRKMQKYHSGKTVVLDFRRLSPHFQLFPWQYSITLIKCRNWSLAVALSAQVLSWLHTADIVQLPKYKNSNKDHFGMTSHSCLKHFAPLMKQILRTLLAEHTHTHREAR